jgi:hypothetical protein
LRSESQVYNPGDEGWKLDRTDKKRREVRELKEVKCRRFDDFRSPEDKSVGSSGGSQTLWGTAITGKRRELDERKCILLCRNLAPGVDTHRRKKKEIRD